MKKLIVLIFMVLFLASCSQQFSRSEFLQHDTMYKNWDHMKFSLAGPDVATSQDVEKSMDQQWWGIDVPYVPGQ